jgi:cation-transporting P-type ATPase C
VDDLVPGDMVVLHTGEKVCVDGIIEEGEALFDEAPITGRAELAHKGPGQEVFAGTFVRQGVVYVRADRVGDCTYLARIMRKVQDSLESRAPIEGVADRLAATLVRVGGAATLGTFLLTGSAWRAFTVLLVMACPCATALAASTAVSASLSAAARRHILIKGGRYLEEIGSCDTVCFDKTGTLTTSEPALALAAPAEGVDGATLLRLAVSAEAHNHHPLAQALKAEAARLGIEPLAHSVCHYELGMGMRAEVGGEEIVVGNAKLARLFGLNVAELEEAARGPRERGMTVLYAFRAGAPLGVLAFESREREGAREVVRRLRGLGVRRFMLVTGDEQATARDMARRLDIDEVHASVLPGDKARIVEAAMARGHKVLMVGDGINDALALARVDVGVAVGTGGSEVAVEAADIALVADDLEGLADVYGLSRRTLAVVRQNFWIATGSNVAGVALGALGLLSPVAAGLLHVGHSLGVLANSSRLLGFAAGGQGDAERSTGGDHGFSRAGGAAQVSEREAPPAGQDQDQVRRGHHPGPGGAAPGAVQR